MVKARNIKYVGIITLIGSPIGMFFTVSGLLGTDFEPLLPLIGLSMVSVGILVFVFSLHLAALAETVDEIHEILKK
jgi:hypothetical protein